MNEDEADLVTKEGGDVVIFTKDRLVSYALDLEKQAERLICRLAEKNKQLGEAKREIKKLRKELSWVRKNLNVSERVLKDKFEMQTERQSLIEQVLATIAEYEPETIYDSAELGFKVVSLEELRELVSMAANEYVSYERHIGCGTKRG